MVMLQTTPRDSVFGSISLFAVAFTCNFQVRLRCPTRSYGASKIMLKWICLLSVFVVVYYFILTWGKGKSNLQVLASLCWCYLKVFLHLQVSFSCLLLWRVFHEFHFLADNEKQIDAQMVFFRTTCVDCLYVIESNAINKRTEYWCPLSFVILELLQSISSGFSLQ